uniref:Forkhead box protein N3 n=1 Tax=Schistocephalus solidus TaxID=70667 RepID=A0A0X3NM93_SCHSO
MNENVIEILAASQLGQNRLMPLNSSPEVPHFPSHPEDTALTEELSSLDWLQTENLLPGTIKPTQNVANQKTLAERACLQTVCFAGCVHSIDERINEDLHSLNWLQDSNLLPISPIDSEEDLPFNSATQASSIPKVPDNTDNLAASLVTVPREHFGQTSPRVSNGGPFPRLPITKSVTECTIRPNETVLTLAKTIQSNNVPAFLSPKSKKPQRLIFPPACVFKGVTNLPVRSSLFPRRRVHTEVEEQKEATCVSPLKRGCKNFVEKPIFTYAQLAFMAIESSPSKALEFSQIWEWCKNSFPAYNIDSRLKACLRHILSSNASFQRVLQGQGRLSQWKIRPEMKQKLLQSLRFIAVDAGRTLSPDVERLLQQAEESFFTPERSKIAKPLDL